MALAVKDGNQADTFLSSVVTGGEHIVAHSVVSLGATAISNIASAISGSVVSISNLPTTQAVTFGTATITGSASILNFPSSQTIAGTVTANISGTVPASISSVPTHGVTIANSSVTVNGTFYQATQPVSLASLPSLAAGTAQIGSVTASISGTPSVTFGATTGSVSVLNFPATQTIAGTVTALLSSTVSPSLTGVYDGDPYPAGSRIIAVGGWTDEQDGAHWQALRLTDKGLLQCYNVGVVTANVLGTNGILNIPLNIADSTEGFQNGARVGVAIIDGDGNEFGRDGASPFLVSGTVTANVASLQKVTLIDGSGSVVTANSAVQVFATTTTRSYLLVQVTTGSAYVNVGATATTANGIYLASGQGYAWETTIPQGVCSLISTVTGTAYCAKQA